MKQEFELADGFVKQLLTLATASLAGVIAFFDDTKVSGVQVSGSWLLITSVVCLALSVVAGLLALGALIWELSKRDEEPDVNAALVRWTSLVQMVSFGGGVLFVAVEVSV